MNQQEIQDFFARVPPRIMALVMLKMSKHVTKSKEPRKPDITIAMHRFLEEAQELVVAIKNEGAESAETIKSECADVVAMAMLIFDLMDDRITKHPEPRYFYQFARDSNIGLKEGN